MIQDIRIDLLDITKQEELFEVFASKFSFPPYFWDNWDAFFDVMSSISAHDLIWIEYSDSITWIHLILIHFNSFQESFSVSEQEIFRTILDDLAENSSISKDQFSFTFEIQYAS